MSDRTPVINFRQHHQHDRIQNGIESGQLTRAEARQLRQEERAIQTEKRLSKADGNVTPEERAAMRQHLNEASRDIYQLKHNDQTRKYC